MNPTWTYRIVADGMEIILPRPDANGRILSINDQEFIAINGLWHRLPIHVEPEADQPHIATNSNHQ